MTYRKLFLPAFALIFALAPLAHAQFGSGIVYDPTQSAHAIEQIEQGSQSLQTAEQIYTTAYKTMNQVIAAYNLAYQMSKMPQNLAARYQSDFSMWTNFSSASAPDTYGNTSAWINALDLGNPTRATSAYNAAVIPLQTYPSSALSSRMPPRRPLSRTNMRPPSLGRQQLQILSQLWALSVLIPRPSSRSWRIFKPTPIQLIPPNKPRMRCSARSTRPPCSSFTRSRTPTRYLLPLPRTRRSTPKNS